MSVVSDPHEELPRDESGSYLHLKLKRFSDINDLTMPFAKKTWKETPQDANVGMATTGRSSCRQCHKKIDKGSLRFQLWLQCHKGCKNSAYFHSDCIWKYPETSKIDSVDEFKGIDDLPKLEKDKLLKNYNLFCHLKTIKNKMMFMTKKNKRSKNASGLPKTKKNNGCVENLLFVFSYFPFDKFLF